MRHATGKGGLWVETCSGAWTGTNWGSECDLSRSSDVRHVVYILNLMTHTAKIACRGSITANPRDVEYRYPGTTSKSKDTAIEWNATDELGDKGYKTFHHAQLVSINKGGNANIQTMVNANWPTVDPLVPMVALQLSFDVNT